MAQMHIVIDGEKVAVQQGQSVAGVLFQRGQRALFAASSYNAVRTFYCGMGLCHQCLVTVDGTWHVRVCLTEVVDGMHVDTHFEVAP